MKIEDEELCNTFKIASEEHLEKLNEGLLHLEKYPDDREKLQEMMREAHSLKGDAGMLGIKDVANLAHQIEHILGTVDRGETFLSPTLSDRLYDGLDAITKLVHEAVTGESSDINTFYVLAHLMGAETKLSRTTTNISQNFEAFVAGSDRTPPAPEEAQNPTPNLNGDVSPPSAIAVGHSPHYIDDDELRETFKIASEEHLQKLDAGLLHLEKYPSDRVKLEEMLREAHSIKGDAGMLGVQIVSTLAHLWEQLLGSTKQPQVNPSPQLWDRLYQGLDAIRQLIQEAVTGEPSGVNIDKAIAVLQAADSTKVSHLPETLDPLLIATTDNLDPLDPGNPEALPTLADMNGSGNPQGSLNLSPSPAIANNPVLTSVAPATINSKDGYRIETIRVETRNLDSLMTQAGELTVTKIRIAHRLAEIEEMVALTEEWSRDSFLHRISVDEGERKIHHGNLAEIQDFHRRIEERLETLGTIVNSLRTAIYEDTARLDIISTELEEGIRTLRLLPLATIFNLFPRMVRDLAKQQDKQVEMIIEGGETRADKRILEEMKDPLLHMIRNAIDHGIETPAEREKLGKPAVATIRLRGYQTASNIFIEVTDDGRGLNLERIKQTAIKRGICRPEEITTMTPMQIHSLIFMPGFSTRTFVTEVSGRGVGLDVVRTNVERLKGSIHVESTPGQGCTVRVSLGTTLATAHVLLISVDGMIYALPVEFVMMAKLIPLDEIFSIEGRETILLEGQPISVVRLADLLELGDRTLNHTFNSDSDMLSPSPLEVTSFPCIILKVGEDFLGLLVDALLDEQDVLLKPQSQLLKRVRNVSGATILGTGEVCMVLNPQDLLKSVRKQNQPALFTKSAHEAEQKQVILLVEDSIAIRTQEKRILESAGYEVITAVDGLDGWNKLKSRPFDAVVSDVQMPNLDGFSLTSRIRQQKQYTELPVILVTSLSTEEDKRRGAEAGANAYITKNSFNQEVLVETLKRLV